MYIINEKEFEVYEAASGDYCVTVADFKGEQSYNCGSLESALRFVLSYCEVDNDN